MKMETVKFGHEEKPKGDAPDYTNDGIAVWENKDKNGNPYLTMQFFGKNGMKLVAFWNKNKQR